MSVLNRVKKYIAAAAAFSMAVSAFPVMGVYAEGNTAPSAPDGLLTNELVHPMNVEKPVFGWIVNDADENDVQTAYEVVVTDEITGTTVWDSGKVSSSEQSYIAYGGELESGHPYSWKVKTWDSSDAESPYSENAYFSSGIKNADWKADWINSGSTSVNHYWLARYEEQLDTSKTIASAEAYFCGVHDYALNINGQYIGRGQSFDYLSESRYQGWDITDAVKSNPSGLAVGITARWYGEGQGRAKESEQLIGHINVYYTDGTKQEISTGSDWKVTASTPFSGKTKNGGEGDFVEEYNAQNEAGEFSVYGYDDSTWTAANVVGTHPTSEVPSLTPELSKPTEYEVKPVSVKVLDDGTTVADFGKVIPARPTVVFKNGKTGTKLAIQTGYVLNTDGSINTDKSATQSTDMRFIYTQKDGERTYNAWNHYAFRYISIPACGESFSADDITARVVHTDVPNGRESTFVSSNEMLNNVYELMQRSALYSIQNSFVDTPTREKGQFLQDAINISDASTTSVYERAASKKAIEQFMASADRYWTGDEAGRYNSVYPNGDGKRDIPDFTINFPYWVYSYYMQTGDKELLERAYPYVKATAEYITKYINSSTGLVTMLGGGDGSPNSYQYGIVDWPAVGRFGYDWSNTKTGARTTVNMLSKRAFDVVGLMAEELGNTDDFNDMKSRSENIKTAINSRLINSNGVYCDGLNANGNQVAHASQHGTSYAIAFDVAPEDKKKQMAEYIADMGMKQGPMTADILAKALFESDETAAAIELFTEPYDNGWAKEVNKDYSFTWESWDANSSENSQSHGWGAAAAKQMLENFAGVSVTEAGAKKIKIEPEYCALTSLDTEVSTERGKVGVKYTRSENRFDITITVPSNVEAEINLPNIGDGEFVRTNGESLKSEKTENAQTMTAGGGTYEFSYRGNITVQPEEPQYKPKPIDGIIGSNDESNKEYIWQIGESDAAAAAGVEYTQSNDYADLKVSLGKGDSLSNAVKFTASSVKETNTSGQASVNDTKRYIMVSPKYDGEFNITMSFPDATSKKKQRIYYADLGTDISSIDLSLYQKESHSKAGDDITSSGEAVRSIPMEAGHSYIIYTYQNGSTISAMSYKYTGEAITTPTPAVPTAAPTVTPTAAPSVTPTAAPMATPDPDEKIIIKNRTADGDKLSYSLETVNQSDGVIIGAVYDESGRLYSIASQPVNNNGANLTLNIPSEEQPANVKLMLRKTLDSLEPISAVKADRYEYKNEVESNSIVLDRETYPLVVGNKDKTSFTDWETNGSSFTLNAEVNSDEYNVSDIEWQVEDDSIAYIKESSGGKAVIKGKRTGFTNVKALLPNGESKKCAVSVIDNITRSTVQTLELNTNSLTMSKGSEAQLIPIIYPKDIFNNGALNSAVSWNSSDTSVATVENGTVKAVGNGSAKITVTSEDVGRTAECTVIVSDNADNAEITADNTAVKNMQVGQSQQLNVQSAGKLTWRSDNSYIADVDENGVVTAYSNSRVPKLIDNPNYEEGSSDVTKAASKTIVFEDGKVQYETGTVKIYATAPNGETAVFEVCVNDTPEAVHYDTIGTYSVEPKNWDNGEGSPYLRNLHVPEETITDNSVNLLWNSSSKMDIDDFGEYKVYVNGNETAAVNTLGYTVNGLESNERYSIKVEAVKNDGSIAAEEKLDVTTKPKSEIVNVLDYGAKGNGKVLDTYAIQNAINNCPENGTVYLPKGYVFYSGALFLKSNMTFKVDGILMGSSDSKDYPLTETRWEGWKKTNKPAAEWANTTDDLPDNHYAYASLINAGTYDEGDGVYNVENIVICGSGQINANGFKLAYNEGLNHKTGNGGIPVPSSPAIDQTIRGRAITFHNAKNVYMKDVQVAYGPAWTIHPIYCDSITFDNLDIVSKGDGKTGAADDICILNGDGIDPDSSTNINIFNTYFYAGDDAVAVKTGRNKEGNELNKPVRYLRITDCESNGSKGGFAVGSENASGVKDVLFQNLKIRNITLSHGIWFKTYWSRGGVSENVVIRDIDSQKPLAFVMNYATSENNPADTVPEYKNFTIENCNSSLSFEGFKAEKGHDGSMIHDVTVRGCKSGTIKYGYNFNIYGSDSSKWNLSNTESINIYADGYLEDTALRVKEGSTGIYGIDNDVKIITVFSGITADTLKNEIASLKGGSQTYEVSTDGELKDSDTVTVTSQDGEHTELYVIAVASAGSIKTWDFSSYDNEVTCDKTSSDSVQVFEYDGLKVSLANNAADSDHDKITSGGVYWRGGASSGDSPRYIEYTPEKDGILYAYGKMNASNGRWGISESLNVNLFAGGSESSTSTSLSKVSYECKAGTAYYIIPKGKSASVTKIEYIEAE